MAVAPSRPGKIIQIALGASRLYALDDKGRVWAMSFAENTWSDLPPLPADQDGREWPKRPSRHLHP